ncbi:MAG TPA: hypothetical protein VGW38_28670 [Chloroflexota bacterium]|nr:hypothetical protein [Chloroflexota bacterium]
MAYVVDRVAVEGDALSPVEVRGGAIEQAAGGTLQGRDLGPPAVIAELVLEVTPDALDQVELRRIGGQPQGADAVAVGHPSAVDHVAVVVADIVKHHDHLPLRELGHHLIEEAYEGGAVLVALVRHTTRPVA